MLVLLGQSDRARRGEIDDHAEEVKATMIRILETVWRTVPWAHAVHYCQGDVLVVLRKQDKRKERLEGPEWNWRWQPENLAGWVRSKLGPDVAVKVIVV